MAKLIECIPNFSLSKEKNEAGYNTLIEVAKSVPGCMECVAEQSSTAPACCSF